MQENEPSKRPIRLKLVTEIRDGSRKEMLTMEADGTLYGKEGATYISYKEMMEGIGKVSTTVKIKRDELTIIRSGGISMNHTYRTGQTTISTYHGPYGSLEMLTKTENMEYVYRTNSQKGRLTLAYQLHMQGEAVGRHRLIFMIKEI
ncbi:DUF1934 domain-containing protein [Calidifontibacillus oryziterrae]|uniref:DUF1934 domain-containing protein n=1 Tax=Calidifontibacillus oryziterrae TaxID=1191699 RepID=UPI0002D6C9F4|nr:DUF1934 domain-containing protein [Calidifontibacillus oryziterrae]